MNQTVKHKKRMPLGLIMAFLMAATLICVSAFVTFGIYGHEKNTLIENERSDAAQMAQLRLVNLDNYFDELAQFCVQTCYETDLYQAMTSYDPEFTAISLDDIKNFVRTSYYSRSDLLSYQITFLNQGWSVRRSHSMERPVSLKVDPDQIRSSAGFAACVRSGRNCAVLPDVTENAIHYYHTLIRISDGTPVGLVDLQLDPPFAQSADIEAPVTRYLCMVNSDGTIFYHDLPDELSAAAAAEYIAQDLSSGNIGTEHFLITREDSDRYGIRIYSFSSYHDLMSRLRNNVRSVIARTILFSILIFLILLPVLHFFTRPLTALTVRMQEFGPGHFQHTKVGGCAETAKLAETFNSMSDNIQELIEQNYEVRLQEQQAHLTALEAQINPHFLYNTLQAIGSEALLTDDVAVYEMLTVLADGLRYTLRKDKAVPLKDELLYADNYFRLQKLRKGDDIRLEKRISPDTLDLSIPKLSLQNLVENSIEHGIGEDVTCIHILIEAHITDQTLSLIVTDDGCGMSEEDIALLKERCTQSYLAAPETGIGLPNLYHRLSILYKGAELLIESRTIKVPGTKVTLRLPLDSKRKTENRYTLDMNENTITEENE